MKTKSMMSIVFLGVVLSVLTGCVETQKAQKEAGGIKLNLAANSETVYKVTEESGKDYAFVQPSINKTKEKHSVGRVEMIFSQKIESVSPDGNATADITVDQLKYLSQDAEGKALNFDSTAPNAKSDPFYAIIGQSYKIKIAPDGKVAVVDAAAARQAVKGEGIARKFADKLFSDEEIQRRHQVLALMNAGKAAAKKGDKWSVVAETPAGMLMPKSFEKVYTVTDIKEQNGQKIATITMNAEPSSKHIGGVSQEEAKMGAFEKMFDEKDNYTGKIVLNLSTGIIDSYHEALKAEWLAAEAPRDEEPANSKGPDELKMGFTSLYSIEKVNK